MINSYEESKAILRTRLKNSRYEHSLGVAETAAWLAERFNVDVEQARLAGLLHDCGRMYKTEDLIAEAEKRHIAIGEIERRMPLLLHAYIGAEVAGELYGVTDSAITQAIWKHTVGGSRMTNLDKIIYFADMIEPARNYPEVGRLREMAKVSTLDDCILAGLTASIIFVASKGGYIHPATVEARNEILFAK